MLFSLLQRLSEIPLAFLDVETTGASADFGHRVIELGIVRVEGGRVVAEYQQLIDPQRRIGPGVAALTGISQQMVTGQPTFAEQLPRAMNLLRGAAILGHNIRFDLSFLTREFRRAGAELSAAVGDVPVLDTVRIARRRFGRGGNGLQALAPRLGVTPDGAHRALADARTTAGVFERLMAPVGGWEMTLLDAIQEQGGPMGLLPTNPRESLLPLELEEALEQQCPVEMEYLDARQARTCRVIRPLHIRRVSGELILIAYCELRNDRRTFKVERIVRLMRLTRDASPPVLPSLALVAAPSSPASPTDRDAGPCCSAELIDFAQIPAAAAISEANEESVSNEDAPTHAPPSPVTASLNEASLLNEDACAATAPLASGDGDGEAFLRDDGALFPAAAVTHSDSEESFGLRPQETFLFARHDDEKRDRDKECAYSVVSSNYDRSPDPTRTQVDPEPPTDPGAANDPGNI